MARPARALRGIFGEMLDRLLRRVELKGARGLGSPARGDPITRAAARRRALTEALTYAEEASTSTGMKPTIVAAAVDTAMGRTYRGASREGVAVPPSLRARLPKPGIENWPPDNCAEVGAAARAIDDGARLDDLVIVAVRRSQRADGLPEAPCRNCRTWVPAAEEPA